MEQPAPNGHYVIDCAMHSAFTYARSRSGLTRPLRPTLLRLLVRDLVRWRRSSRQLKPHLARIVSVVSG
jgi:hypothetical protein